MNTKQSRNACSSKHNRCCAGTECTLRGCVNDVKAINEMLTKYYGFQQANIRTLVDTDTSNPNASPTGANIKKNLKELVLMSAPNDVLVFHFSGHGTQVRPQRWLQPPLACSVPYTAEQVHVALFVCSCPLAWCSMVLSRFIS
jgi:hypothetical protein